MPMIVAPTQNSCASFRRLVVFDELRQEFEAGALGRFRLRVEFDQTGDLAQRLPVPPFRLDDANLHNHLTLHRFYSVSFHPKLSLAVRGSCGLVSTAVLLPSLMLDDNVLPALGMVDYVKRQQGRSIELDATKVLTLQPSAACLIAVAARSARESGKTFRIAGLRPHLQLLVSQLDPAIELAGPTSADSNVPAPDEDTSIATQICAAREANTEVSRLATYIAQFIPNEDQAEMSLDQYGLRIHHAIQPALAYILAELVDNVFSHAATEEYRSPHAYMAVQSYSVGDRLRVAVVDDGCGLFGSLRSLLPEPPRNHYEAVTRAFEPFVSSKSMPMIYAERKHMGLGLPVCGQICRQLGGDIYAVTGNAWVQDPGFPSQLNRHAEPFFQGTVVCLEIFRRGVTNRLLQDALTHFSGSPDLRLKFS